MGRIGAEQSALFFYLAGGDMYDSRSWFSSWLFMGLCFCFWFFAWSSSSLAANSNPANYGSSSSGQVFEYDGNLYTLGSYLGGTFKRSHAIFFSESGSFYVYWKYGNYDGSYYHKFSSGAVTSLDADNDGASFYNDPCPDSEDNYFTNYKVSNICDGSYYFFQITGECGETKTYFNPKYATVNDAYSDSMAHPECTDISYGSFTPEQFENWMLTHSSETGSGGTLNFDNVNNINPTGATGSASNSTASEVDSEDESAQDIIDAIKLMRDNLGDKLDKNTSDLKDKMQIETDRVVSAMRTVGNNVTSLGTSISGVTSAVNSAGTTAHADALALKTAIEGIKSGNATATTSGGMSSDDMRSIIEEDRNLVYTADPGINTDTGLASQGLISSIVGIVGTIQTKVQSIVPDLDVDTSSASPCISGGSITFPDGSSHAVNGLCLDSYENHFVMVGNVLYAFVCIVGVLSIFGMRRE